ncbi:MAG TPA: hypothetical protein VF236_06990 [Gaiellaceae bacterium]
MKHHRTWIAVLAILLGLAAAPAYADDDDDGGSPAVATLTGENFLASEFPQSIGSLVVEGTCDLLGTSTFTFTATGQATGPYPGTFTESGTAVVGSFMALSFESTFEIDSPAGTVTGTKLLVDFTQTSIGLCGTAAFPMADASAMRLEATLSYTANIVTPTASATDSGTAFVNMGDTQVRGVPDAGGFVFSENFTSTSSDAPCEDDDDDDDDDGGDDDECDDDEDDDDDD